MRLFLIFICALAIFTSCRKDHSVLDAGVQPDNDELNGTYTEALHVRAISQPGEHVISYNTTLKYLGCNTDPEFGTTTAGINLNANLQTAILGFGSDPKLESSEIVLAVNPYYGDKDAVLSYSVYTLDSALSTKRNYYTSNDKLHNPAHLVGQYTGSYVSMQSRNYLRIPVTSSFAAQVLVDIPKLKTNEEFQKVYKGFYIVCGKAQGSEGVMHLCDLEDGLSGFYLHYKSHDTAVSQSFNLPFNGGSAVRFNTFAYDPSGAHADLSAQLTGDTTRTAAHLFQKGITGPRIRIEIPGLSALADSFPVAINRAELIFNVAADLPPSFKYKALPAMALLPISASGGDTIAADQFNSTDNGRYGGGYDSTGQKYVFNIARQVQAICNGTKANRGFYLVGASPVANFTALRDQYIQRVILSGTGTALRPALRLSYIKLKHK